jgi:hypothetical protein
VFEASLKRHTEREEEKEEAARRKIEKFPFIFLVMNDCAKLVTIQEIKLSFSRTQ